LELFNRSLNDLKASKQAELDSETKKFQSIIADSEFKSIYSKYPELRLEAVSPPYPQVANENLEKYNKLKAMKETLNNKATNQQLLTMSPAWYMANLNNNIKNLQQSIISKKKNQDDIKSKPELLKKVWVPTIANLKNKTRKDILDNLTNMSKMMVLPGLNNKQRATLFWLSSVTSQNLNFLSNPFSWHEYTGGTVEAPSTGKVKIADCEKLFAPGAILGTDNGYNGPGLGGGMYGQ
jgi:hypothetical protein